jgi:hypothetical protein
MTEGIPADEVPEQLAASPAGTVTAACVGGNTDNGGGHEEVDEYDELLAGFGRTEEEDERISVHEAGHAICARILGHPLGGATVNPDPNGKYGGLVWGPRHSAAYGKDDDPDDVPELCDKLGALMPKDGEARSDAADIYLHALNRCIELAAAAVAERMLLPGNPVPSVSDIEQAVGLASLCCKSPQAVERFLAFCEQQAHDLLYPHAPIIMSLSIVLRNARTLDGAEIDKIIADQQALKARAIEHRRRADWRKRELAAASFHAECHHPNAASPSHFAPDRLG